MAFTALLVQGSHVTYSSVPFRGGRITVLLLVQTETNGHNQVIMSFLQRVTGGTRTTTEGSRENIGHNVHV